jgi:hypothetical protein
MEQRLTLEVELDMLADERQSTHPRDAAVWRAVLLAAQHFLDSHCSDCARTGGAIADHLLGVMAVELADVGDIHKCKFPDEVAGFCRFVAMEWPAPLTRRAGGRHG